MSNNISEEEPQEEHKDQESEAQDQDQEINESDQDTEQMLPHIDRPESSDQKKTDPSFKIGKDYQFVRVRFPGNARSQQFIIGEISFNYGQKVVAMSDRGLTVGHINSFPYKQKLRRDMLPAVAITRTATEKDISDHKFNVDQEKKAELSCKRLIEKYKLDMNITHVEYIIFNKKFVFYFNAPERVDFRHLVKDLIGELKSRIELRQISVRDRAAAIGAIGPCGLQTCCSSFLKNYGNVTIKMAKNQNLALLPNKINGVCGQIKCCIRFEDQVYTKKRALLPTEGRFVQVKNGDCGKVLKLHVIIEEFEMLTDKGLKRRYSITEYNTKVCSPPSDWKFPKTFDHIINETSTLIQTKDTLNGATSTEVALPKNISESDKNLINTKVDSDIPKEQKKTEEKRPSQNRRKRKPQNKNATKKSPVPVSANDSHKKSHDTAGDNNGQKSNNNQKRRFNKSNSRSSKNSTPKT